MLSEGKEHETDVLKERPLFYYVSIMSLGCCFFYKKEQTDGWAGGLWIDWWTDGWRDGWRG